MITTLLRIVVSLTCLATATAGYAQEGQIVPADVRPEKAGVPNNRAKQADHGVAANAETEQASQQNSGLAEIIVAAQKREQRLQDVPAAVALTAETLINRGINDVTGVTRAVPA